MISESVYILADAVLKRALLVRAACRMPIDQKDDQYMGYRIPKGSVVVPSFWVMKMDDEVYGKDMADFRTSRWTENPDLPLASFGYGRRMCTGQHVAMSSLFINIARVVWAFDIEPAVDANGKPILADLLACSQGFDSGPLPFKARFVVRSPERQAVVEQKWTSADKEVSAALDGIERAAAISAARDGIESVTARGS